jgi:hypothetical protein
MTATQLARDAVREARKAAPYLSLNVIEDMARARLALAVLLMDDSTPAAVRLMRLDDGFSAIREIIFGTATGGAA